MRVATTCGDAEPALAGPGVGDDHDDLEFARRRPPARLEHRQFGWPVFEN